MSAHTVKPPLIALDEDENVLHAISRVAAPYFHVLVTRDPRRLLGWLENYPKLAVVVTEHVLRTSNGVSLLETARTMRPGARRVLLTTYSDLASIVAGLHSGAIERLVQKPFGPADLLRGIMPDGFDEATGDAGQRASA
jgi:two-component system response regulator AtoC/two-component system response regulator HupR/HoxA